MAKTAKPSSTPVWIWLRDALAFAVAALGDRQPLANEKLIEWLATKKLPWTCHEWKGLDAEGLAKLKQELPRVRTASTNMETLAP